VVTLPPTIPNVLLQQPSVPVSSVPVVLDAVSVTSTVAALQQRVVVSVLAVEVNLQQSLLNILTQQGQLSLSLPPSTASTQITLPNGQQVPLQSVLASLTPAQIKSGMFLQIDPSLAGPNGLPSMRLLLSPELLSIKPDALSPQQTQAASLNITNTDAATGPLRTTAYPLPPEAIASIQTKVENVAQQAGNNLIARFMSTLSGSAPQQAGNPPAPATGGTNPNATPTAPQNNTPTNTNPANTAPRNVELLAQPQAGAEKATIIGATPRGDTVVRLGNGETLSLAHIRGGQPGETLYIKNIPAGGAIPATEESAMPPALREALDILETVNPALAARVIAQTTLPLHHANAAPQVAGSMLFFMSALGASFNNAAVSPAISQILERTLSRAARDKLVDELGNITRTLPDAAGIEWRGHQIPTPANLDGLHSQVWFYVQQRQHRGPDDGTSDNAQTGKQQGQTRFVIDLDLSRMGHTQLEGIAATGRVDLKLNTRVTLPNEMQQELVQTYANIASAYGFTGDLIFTNGNYIDLRRRPTTSVSS